MPYIGIDLKDSITVGKLYSIHYFEYMSDFKFPGESHDFWEFICVDKGDVAVTGGDRQMILNRGEVAFHQPGEFHTVQATGHSAPNLVVISFQCDSPAMDFFREKVLQVDETERNLLADIVIEARHCFDCRLDDPYLQNMPQKEAEQFGAEQLIRLYLEHFLIHLLRRCSQPSPWGNQPSGPSPRRPPRKRATSSSSTGWWTTWRPTWGATSPSSRCAVKISSAAPSSRRFSGSRAVLASSSTFLS